MFSFILLMVLGVRSIELTTSNYDDITKGKTTFVKFYAPWCGHCKSMKPAWDKLNRKYGQTKEFLVIGEVDCTGKGKELCDANDVQGYPTLKYGNPQALEPYTGGRDGKSLRIFVESLTPLCSPENTEHCDDAGKALIEKFMKYSQEDLEKGIKEAEKKIFDAEQHFAKEVKRLQSVFKKLQAEKEIINQKVKTEGLAEMRTVSKYKHIVAQRDAALKEQEEDEKKAKEEDAKEDKAKEDAKEDKAKEDAKEDSKEDKAKEDAKEEVKEEVKEPKVKEEL